MKLEMNFDKTFFDEEIRCEYMVSQKQKKIWACELDLANKLLYVCNKYDIRIIGYAGTMLGAIRHKGFIPWDDDMDFCMLRNDFYKLLQIADKEFQNPYFFQTALSDRRYFCGYGRLRNSTTTAIIEGQDENYNNGIYIDIWVIDGLIDDDKLFRNQIKDRDFANRLAKLFLPLRSGNSVLRKTVKTSLRMILSLVTNYEDSVKRYWNVLERYNKTADKFTLMTHPLDVIKKYWIARENLEKLILVPFENIMIPVPQNYDQILSTIYGDYMKFPPVSERGKWHEGQIVFEPDIPYTEYYRKKKSNEN